ncbi:MAG: hypothetical protein A2Z88_10900 [Omnitrophica WOR_2 bacterium GWA2_47_8]|nr:MAG: hypothetical protein A2Z88_10900 [Omnitrophica WOR_2 bacterium GWA2_47_8]
MGTGFSIDTPIKVAHYGISSVISLVDDTLIERIRKFYCEKFSLPYTPITKYEEDFRARRITEYLNLVDKIVQKQFTELKNSAFEVGTEITKYFELLPDHSPLKKLYARMLSMTDPKERLAVQKQLRDSIEPGDISVNIMTKLDRPNFAQDGKELPQEYSDALAALRGFAQSTLASAIVFSAGINRRLYSYVENFKDFYADTSGNIKKKIIIKVSDYRSAFTQGKFFAKKGIWVSEYRIESGLNCGGHVFPAAGELMGPILEEFKTKRADFIATLHGVYNQALQLKAKFAFWKPLDIKVTAQGGIGTASEDRFLHEHYGVDGTGWATPFLLVPEVTNVDATTLKRLSDATEDDLYISDVSPLGVSFNNLKGSLSDEEKDRKFQKGRPGSACPKGHLVTNTEFTEKPICTASRQYQKLKIEQLQAANLPEPVYQKAVQNVIKKACICNELGDGALLKNNITDAQRQLFPAVCPGPNIAYFTKISTLKEMVDHIYGRLNLLNNTYRPHMFIKELMLNIDYLKKEVTDALPGLSENNLRYFYEFKMNLRKGMDHYIGLFPQMMNETVELRKRSLEELHNFRSQFEEFVTNNPTVFSYVPAHNLQAIEA